MNGRLSATAMLASAIFAGLTMQAVAAEYFVDSVDGNDNAAGTSEATAWKTLHKVNSVKVLPGDTVRLRRGGLWRETLVPHSGEPGRPVTYTTYGSGVKPILQQSVDCSRAEDWYEVEPGIWSTRGSEPAVHEQVWRPHDGVRFNGTFQNGMEGSVRKIAEDGCDFWRVELTKRGPKPAPHLIQVWGPEMADLPATAILKLRLRASKPFPLSGVQIMMPHHPWTLSHGGGLKPDDQKIGTDWREVAVFLKSSGKTPSSKPRFHMSLGDVMPEGGALDIALVGVWRSEVDPNASIDADVGLFLCNHGEKWGVKKFNNPEWDVPGEEKWQRTIGLKKELDFWYDPDNRRVLVRHDENPGKAYKSIELAVKKHIVRQDGCHDIVYDGLWLRYGAAHGFGGGSTANLVIRNCDICWIGGGLQTWMRDAKTGKIRYPVRYGNGIEFWADCRNHLVERCRLWEIYDAAVTNQGRQSDETDIVWRDNVIWNSEFSYEYWNARMTRNVLFEHNTCVDAGHGWAHAQRPDPNGAHLMYYSNRAATTNFVVRDNIFCRTTEWTCLSVIDWRSGLVHDHNLYWNEESVPVMRWGPWGRQKSLPWADYVKDLQMDLHSAFAEPQFVDPSRRDYRLRPGSPGLTLASDGGPVGARNMPGLDRDQSIR